MLDFSAHSIRDVGDTYLEVPSPCVSNFTDLNRSCSLIGHSTLLPCARPGMDNHSVFQIVIVHTNDILLFAYG